MEDLEWEDAGGICVTRQAEKIPRTGISVTGNLYDASV